MDIIPAIDILDGKCVRLYQGDYTQSEVFSQNPQEMALRFQAEGATRLHLVDLDGAKEGRPVNFKIIESIVKSVSIPVQVGGGLRSRDAVQKLVELGVSRVILGTIAVEQPELVGQLSQEFAGKIIIGIDARDGKVATRGWLETSSLSAVELAQKMSKLGASGIIYTDIQRDGTLCGPNIPALSSLVTQVDIPVIASGGVSSLSDLLSLVSLEASGLEGVIIGKAIYTGAVSIKEAVQAVGPGRWQDVPLNLGDTRLV